MPNERLLNPPFANLASEYLFQVWGRATVISSDAFLLDDGGRYKTKIISQDHGVCNGDYVIARGILDPNSYPYSLYYSHYRILDAALENL